MIENKRINPCFGDIFETHKAKWIGKSKVLGSESAPAPLIRKIAQLKKEVSKATLYVTGLGQYEGFVNGMALDEKIVFAPTVSDYEKTVYYNKYDITSKLKNGENVFGFILGRGRYAFNTAGTPWNGETALWADQVKMIAVAEVEYRDNTKDYIVTDESWEAKDSGILQDCMYMGETFDARVHDFEWKSSKSTKGWENCVQVSKPRGTLTYDFSEPIAVTEKVKPKLCKKISDRQFMLEFDKYLTGWIELQIDCEKDTEVSIQYTERLDEKGVPYLFHTITPNGRLQKDFFISSGEKFTYRPMFSYKGFRYVLIEGIENLDISDATGCFVHSDIKSITEFKCSDELINWIHHASRRTILCNFHGLSTDTPVFEKHGWGGDAAAISPSVMYNFDAHKFYRKWMKDFLDSQTDEGEISVIVPTPGWGISGKTRWKAVCGPTPAADVCWPEIVYRLYWCYEDIDALKENYDGLKKYASYLKKWTNGDLIKKGLGDWLAPTGDVMHDYAEPPEGPELVEGAYHIRIFERMTQIAEALGKEDDAKEYALERERLIKIFNDTYFDEEKGYYHKKDYTPFRQSGNVLAIAFGIATDEIRSKVMENLIADLEERDWHTCMGMYTSMYLPIVLSEYGYHKDACKVVMAKGYPGLDYIRQKGASTVSEAWEYDGCRSCCHYAIGAVENWIMTYLCGIHQLAPGYKKVMIDPKLPDGLDNFELSMDTIRGTIKVKCERKNGQVIKSVSVSEKIEAL
ncbi:MAG: hypothetical protein E7394_07685 [Ruminococcaceae bacterium]|nr:hypothetical protein [Oscillospiraceae bacterium]